MPASTAKLVSAASAYEAVGWDYRFETTVWATGPIVAGTLQGDLLVAGSGDPSFDSRGFAACEDWADALGELGIQRIDGANHRRRRRGGGTAAGTGVGVGRPGLLERRAVRRAQHLGESLNGDGVAGGAAPERRRS